MTKKTTTTTATKKPSYHLSMLCEVCGTDINISADTADNFLDLLKSTYKAGWPCKYGHVQPSVLARQGRSIGKSLSELD